MASARGFGDFRNDPSLSAHEIDLIAEGADAGAPLWRAGTVSFTVEVH